MVVRKQDDFSRKGAKAQSLPDSGVPLLEKSYPGN